LVSSDSSLVVSQVCQRGAEVVVSLGVFVLEAESLSEGSKGPHFIPGLRKGHAKVVLGAWALRPQGECRCEEADGLSIARWSPVKGGPGEFVIDPKVARELLLRSLEQRNS